MRIRNTDSHAEISTPAAKRLTAAHNFASAYVCVQAVIDPNRQSRKRPLLIMETSSEGIVDPLMKMDRCLNLLTGEAATASSYDWRLSVVVPVYNEARWLRTIIDRICQIPLRKEIVIVDDCSCDGTRELLAMLEREHREHPQPDNLFRVIYQPRNRGKGAAVRAGFERATGDVILVQDADLEYFPEDYPQLVAPIISGEADVVFGSRYLGATRRVFNFWHCLINQGLTTLSNMMTGLNLTDMETCYKVFRADVLRQITPVLCADRFGFEPEITAAVARRKLRVFETAIRYSPRSYAEGKKIGWRDGLRAVACIVACRFRRNL